MVVKLFQFLVHWVTDQHLSYVDGIELMAIYMTSMFILLIAVFCAALLSIAGKKINRPVLGKYLRFIGRCVIVLSGIYVTWFAFFLGTLPMDIWKTDLSYHEYVFLKMSWGIILLAFGTLFLFVFILWALSLFGKKIKEKVKNEIYNNAYLLMKIIIILGLISWWVVATNSAVNYLGISSQYMKPLLVISIFAVFVLLILVDKRVEGRTVRKIAKTLSKTTDTSSP